MPMQSLTLPFRRFYATMPGPARVAREASTPRAVRLRRSRKGITSTNDITPTERARYDRLKAKGGLTRDGKLISAREWLDNLNARRSRLRGVRMRPQKDGTEVTEVVGQKVYLPNIIFRLVRNATPPGKPYNPFEATFRVPLSLTKLDIRSYLLAVYGLKTTYIRTDIYRSPLKRIATGAFETIKGRTYKRAVVGLVDPFYYPLRLEDMEPEERAKREEWIEKMFSIKTTEYKRKYEALRLTRTNPGQSPTWKWRGPLIANRAQILKLVGERRAKREGLIASQVQEWREKRSQGERIMLPKKRQPAPADEPVP